MGSLPLLFMWVWEPWFLGEESLSEPYLTGTTCGSLTVSRFPCEVWLAVMEMSPSPYLCLIKLLQYVLMNKWGEPFRTLPNSLAVRPRASCPDWAVSVLRPNSWSCLSTEHCTRGVSWPSAAVYGAPAAGGMEVEQAGRPNPGYR